jgi:hypothetical protein
MLDLQKAFSDVITKYDFNRDLFYGTAVGLSLGAGLIYRDVIYPSFDDAVYRYDTVSGLAYVLSHECDVSSDNVRHFNQEVLVIPIIDFGEFAVSYAEEHSEGGLFAFLDHLAKNRVFRVLYVPPIPQHICPDTLRYGGLLYFNNICSSPTTCFGGEGAKVVCAVSLYGFRIVDYKIANHLLRPKEEILPRLQ